VDGIFDYRTTLEFTGPSTWRAEAREEIDGCALCKELEKASHLEKCMNHCFRSLPHEMSGFVRTSRLE
jgi:hypothetical protein